MCAFVKKKKSKDTAEADAQRSHPGDEHTDI